MDEHRTFRVRTDVGMDGLLNVPINQTFETIDILSLKLEQKNAYKLYDCGYGIVVGRVLANEGFGIPNAKISIFIPMENSDDARRLQTLYNFSTTNDRGEDGSMYNLLPDFVDKECHQDVGSFYNKRLLLDNDDIIEVFDKYYKYTTTTNNAGDYMIYGVPTGSHLLHVDIDLSDIGILSQTPRDMMYKGFTADLFDSPTKFKKDSNLNSLAQIKRQTKSVFVQPFWGDTTEVTDNVCIVRCDIDIDYKFESTCIFMGSVVTDTGEESVNKNCRTTKDAGRMDKLTTGPGMIEMIRYNERGRIEQASVKGEKLIDDNGVWCYQIPMNLDYMKTDEFGNMVPSDNPKKGIATRAKVRFRISMDEVGGDAVANKRARYLVPNNPELYYDEHGEENENSYAFGSDTDDSDFRNLYWNCVYTVKSYIPRLQKSKNSSDRRFTGIKAVNRPGDNNPMPYNSLSGRLGFNYRMLCLLLKMFVRLVYTVNWILTTIALPALEMYKFFRRISATLGGNDGKGLFAPLGKVFCKCRNFNGDVIEEPCPFETDEECEEWAESYVDVDKQSHICGSDEEMTEDGGGLCFIFWKIYKTIGCGIGLSGLCTDGVDYHPGCIKKVYDYYRTTEDGIGSSNSVAELFNCMENGLAEDNEVFSFNFSNDWVNGVLYFPLWFRFIKGERRYLLGLFKTKSVDKWCNTEKYGHRRLKLYKTCAIDRKLKNGGTELEPIGVENFPEPYDDIYYTVPKGESVIFGYKDEGKDKSNCYGYKCIRTADSCIGDLRGLVKQMETIVGEYVYYYSPGNKVRVRVTDDAYATGFEYVKMFSTDIVLLGSLHDCDLQGIPQFFKKLEPTTYVMPPALVVNDGEEDPYNSTEGKEDLDDDNSTAPDVFIPGTEYTYQTGADWGNRGYRQCNGPDHKGGSSVSSEQYADGGLFYGLTCSNIYTKPKTCVNLERVCEYGVLPDISQPIMFDEGGGNIVEKILIPDGYISYDDIVDNYGRTDFATMNSNNLRVRLNPETGYEVYDFDPYYLDNFDGSLHKLMGQDDCRCLNGHDDVRINYFYNFGLENNNYGYSRFRYGYNIKQLGYSSEPNGVMTNIIKKGKKIKFNNGLISTKNSFYFYFGLKRGKTAIEKFFVDYFSPCNTDESEHLKIEVEKQANSICNSGDGYLLLTMYGIETPYTVSFIAANEASHDLIIGGLEDERISFGSCPSALQAIYTQAIDPNTELPAFLYNDVYQVEITGPDNLVIETFDLDFTNGSISSTVSPVTFLVSNETLYDANQTPTYDNVASDSNRYTNQQQEGGYVFVSYPTNSVTGELIENYRFELSAYDDNDFPLVHGTQTNDHYSGYSFNHSNAFPPVSDSFFGDDADNEQFVIGIPKSGVKYKVRITEMCDDVLSDNVYETVVLVKEPEPMKMFVNGIDYSIIKNFSDTGGVNDIIGWLNMANFSKEKPMDEDPTIYYGGMGYILFNAAIEMSRYREPYAPLTPEDPGVCRYNWPEDCYYDLTHFFENSVLYEDVVPQEVLNNVTEFSPEQIILVNTTNNEISIYARNGTTYTPYQPGTETAQYVSDYYDDGLYDTTQTPFVLNQDVYDERVYLIQSINQIITKRSDVSYNVRSVFYTMSEYGGEYDMDIAQEGGIPVINHYIKYTPEDGFGFPMQGSVLETSETLVGGQYSPTITLDRTNYTNYSKHYQRNGNTKPPYEYGIADSLGQTVPDNFSVSGTVLTNQFKVHMIDKPFGCEFESWLPMNNYPNMSNPSENNEMISCDGFIGIKLKNGILRTFQNPPVFDECYIYNGDTIPAIFGNVVPGLNQQTQSLYGHVWTPWEYESRPGTERISYTVDVSGLTIENYKVSRINNQDIQDIGVVGTNNFFPILSTYQNNSRFVCSDGREEIQIDLHPTVQFAFIGGESFVSYQYDSFLQTYSQTISLSLTTTGGYVPNNILLFRASNQNTPYPLTQQITPTNKLNLDSSIMKWDNYSVFLNNRLSDVNVVIGDNVYEVDYAFSSGASLFDQKIYPVAVSGGGNTIKRTYLLGQLIDCTLLQMTSYNGTNVSLVKYQGVGDAFYFTYHDFTAVVRDLHDNILTETEYGPTALPATINVNIQWDPSYKLTIRERSGLEHVVIT